MTAFSNNTILELDTSKPEWSVKKVLKPTIDKQCYWMCYYDKHLILSDWNTGVIYKVGLLFNTRGTRFPVMYTRRPEIRQNYFVSGG